MGPTGKITPVRQTSHPPNIKGKEFMVTIEERQAESIEIVRCECKERGGRQAFVVTRLQRAGKARQRRKARAVRRSEKGGAVPQITHTHALYINAHALVLFYFPIHFNLKDI